LVSRSVPPGRWGFSVGRGCGFFFFFGFAATTLGRIVLVYLAALFLSPPSVYPFCPHVLFLELSFQFSVRAPLVVWLLILSLSWTNHEEVCVPNFRVPDTHSKNKLALFISAQGMFSIDFLIPLISTLVVGCGAPDSIPFRAFSLRPGSGWFFVLVYQKTTPLLPPALKVSAPIIFFPWKPPPF